MEKHFQDQESSVALEGYDKNILITRDLLESFPKHFHQILLDDETEVAVLHKNPLLSKEIKDFLGEFEYFGISKYGVSEFSDRPLHWYMQKDAIQQLLERSLELQGDVYNANIEIKRFVMKHKTRKTKGLRQLKATVRPFEITGSHHLGSAETFYNDILTLLTLSEDLI